MARRVATAIEPGRLDSIGNYLEAHPGGGQLFLAPLDVVLSYHDVVEPDLLFVAGDQREIMRAFFAEPA